VCAFRRITLIDRYTTADFQGIQIIVAAGPEFYRFPYFVGAVRLFKNQEIGALSGEEIYDMFHC